MFTVDFKAQTDSSVETQLEIKVGDQVRITLPENPTTGAQWFYIKPEMMNGEPIYTVLKDEYVKESSSNGDEELMGQGGQRFIILSGEKVGKASWEGVYARPWEFDGNYSNNGQKDSYHKVSITVIPNPELDNDEAPLLQ